jgi:hypothetical protein
MSSSSSDITLASLGSDIGYPNLNVASIPENVREGGSTALKAYAEGLSFEGVLVNELSQQLSSTMFGGQGLDGSSGSDDASSTDGSSSGGLLSAASAYSSLIPQTLTSSIMDSGGLGMADQFAEQIDPSLETAGAASAQTTTSAETTGGQVTTGAASTASEGSLSTTSEGGVSS